MNDIVYTLYLKIGAIHMCIANASKYAITVRVNKLNLKLWKLNITLGGRLSFAHVAHVIAYVSKIQRIHIFEESISILFMKLDTTNKMQKKIF